MVTRKIINTVNKRNAVIKGAIMRVVYTVCTIVFTVFPYAGVYTVFPYEGVYTVFTIIFTVLVYEGVYTVPENVNVNREISK